MDIPQYTPPSPLERKSKVSLVFPLVLILVVTAVSLSTFFFLSRQETTDSRSRATISGRADVEARVSAVGSEQHVRVDVNTDQLASTTDLRGVDVTIRISPEGSVQGATTQISTQSRFPTERMCHDDVREVSGKLYWSSTCKGVPERGNCVTGNVALSEAEAARYRLWVQFKRSPTGRCIEIPIPPEQMVAMGGQAAAPTTTPAPAAASLSPVTLLDTAQYKVEGLLSTAFTYETPVVTADVNTRTLTIQLKARVRGAEAQVMLDKKFPFALVTVKSSGAVSAAVTQKSIKGTTTQAPGVEVELTQ